jgi:SNF family Na+-dependent transporter
MAKKSSVGMGLILIVGLFIAAYEWVQQNLETVLIVVGGLVFVAIVFWIGRRKKHAAWVKHLHEKYKDAEVVDGILNSMFWKGMTEDQLRDSLGKTGCDR